MLDLTPGEKVHSLAIKFYTHFEERLETVRRDLERPKSDQDSNVTRGRIAELRFWMRCWDEEPLIPEEKITAA
jgi:hypothetical protein